MAPTFPLFFFSCLSPAKFHVSDSPKVQRERIVSRGFPKSFAYPSSSRSTKNVFTPADPRHFLFVFVCAGWPLFLQIRRLMEWNQCTHSHCIWPAPLFYASVIFVRHANLARALKQNANRPDTLLLIFFLRRGTSSSKAEQTEIGSINLKKKILDFQK